MDSSKIPQAVANLHSFICTLEMAVPNPSPAFRQLITDWNEIKSFTDAVFYPQEALTNAQKREEMELDIEAQEEVDTLLFELKIDVRDVE